MKKIRRTATFHIRRILELAHTIEAFSKQNDYSGEIITLNEKDISTVLSDIQEGCAILYCLDESTFKLQYAGKCYWDITLPC